MSDKASSKKEIYLQSIERRVAEFYDKRAPSYAAWLRNRRYYYTRQRRILKHVIPCPKTVLDVGCGLGQNLAALQPEYGLGIDISKNMLVEAKRQYPKSKHSHLDFRNISAMKCDELEEKFDTIILINSLTEIPDPVEFFKRLRHVCTPSTRIFNMSYNFLWEPILKIGQRFGLSQGHPDQNWYSKIDYLNIFRLSGFEIVREGRELIFPVGPAVLSDPINRVSSICPGLNSLSMMYYCVARPTGLEDPSERPSTTVVIPCKNEAESIPGTVARIPDLGKESEIVFVNDRSTDDTPAAILEEAKAHPHRNIRMVEGPGQGKGAAVRAGLEGAQGDIFVILDADLTVMPEVLKEFVDALAEGKGEFINGSRLVYPMECGAMRGLNVWGNKLFAHLFSMLISQRIKDTLCGTKAIRKSNYLKLLETREHFGNVDRWGDYDWLFGAARHNLQIVELPVHYRERKAGASKMTKRIENAFIMLHMCYRALFRLKLI